MSPVVRGTPFTPIVLGTIAIIAISACGETVGSLVTRAMDGCISARGPVFASGHGADALTTPLSNDVDAIAMKLRYARGFKMFSTVAENAKDQVTLVCALDLMSYNSDPDVRRFLERYLKHPTPDVVSNVQRLLARAYRADGYRPGELTIGLYGYGAQSGSPMMMSFHRIMRDAA